MMTVALVLLNTSLSFALQSKNACKELEEWNFATEVRPLVVRLFDNYIHRSTPALVGLSTAQWVAQSTKNPTEQLLAKYWEAHAYRRLGFYHRAWDIWNELAAAQPPSSVGTSIHEASLECLIELKAKYSALEFSKSLINNTALYNKKPLPPVTANVFTNLAIQLAGGPKGSDDLKSLDQILQTLDVSPENLPLAKGMVAAARRQDQGAMENLRQFSAKEPTTWAAKKFRDGALLTLGRLYYLAERFDDAAQTYKAVDKNSNWMIPAMAELAWTEILRDHPREAIGTALQFQSGALQKTFSPEAIAAIAVSLNELCQFPLALRSIGHWRKKYRPVFDWLNAWKTNRQPLYSSLIQYIQGEETSIPPQILSDWSRSPVFLSDQEEMNIALDESVRSKKLQALYKDNWNNLIKKWNEESAWAKANQEMVNHFRSQWKGRDLARIEPKDQDESEVAEHMALLAGLKVELNAMKNLLKNLTPLQTQLRAASTRKQIELRDEMEKDLGLRNHLMMEKLKSLAGMMYLVEVEIYNGAAEDVVWQNAHPEYKEFAEDLKAKRRADMASQVYIWGAPQKNREGLSEVWDDEFGTTSANLVDNCSNREKYLDVLLKK